MSEVRVAPVLARLKGGYTKWDLLECVTGYAAFPFVIDGKRCPRGQPAQRFVEPPLIFRSPGHVDRGRALFAEMPSGERGDEFGQRIRALMPDASSVVMAATDRLFPVAS